MEDLKVIEIIHVEDRVKDKLPEFGLTLQEFGEMVIEALNGCYSLDTEEFLAEDDRFVYWVFIDGYTAHVKEVFLNNGETQII